MGTMVKDKVYLMSQHLGIPKAWVPLMLDVSDTTLTKWSYNPENVSKEMSERIFLRVAILDLMPFKFRKTSFFDGGLVRVDFWMATVGDDTFYMKDVRKRLPHDPPKALVSLVRNAIIREEHQHPLYLLHRYRQDHGRRGPLSKIASDRSLEMPLGVIRWEEDRLACKEGDVE